MKLSQKLHVEFESYSVIVRRDGLDHRLQPLAVKLALNGDIYGPVTWFDGVMCITMRYADKTREGVKKICTQSKK